MAYARRNRAASGSMIFMLLVAIAVLAGVSYWVTRSGKSDASNMNREKDLLMANGILRDGDGMAAAVQQIMTNGIDVSKISFETTALGAAYHNAAATAASSVFNEAGGGLTYVAPEAAWLDTAQAAQPFYGHWYFPKDVCVPFVGRGADGSGTTTLCNAAGDVNNELVAVLPYVRAPVCKQIDQSLGLTLCGSGVPCTASATIKPAASSDEFTGSFANGKAFYSASGGLAFNGKQSGCIAGTGSSAGMYFFYRVLSER